MRITVCDLCDTLVEHPPGTVVDKVTAPDGKTCQTVIHGVVVHECEDFSGTAT